MITEIAEFKIRPEDRTAFLEAINRAAVAFLAKSEGYLGHSIYASQESPGRVVLQVQWASLEAHTVGFRQSPRLPSGAKSLARFSSRRPMLSTSTT